MDKGTAVVILIIACLVGGLVVGQPLLPGQQARALPALGILGPNQKVGYYPSGVGANQTFSLYAFLENNEGRAAYYSIFVKVLANSTDLISNVTATNAPVIAKYSYVLPGNENITIPMNLSVPTAGINLRLIFEVWSYDISISNFTYTRVFDYLWLNVTSV